MLKKRYQYYLANHPVIAKQELDVLDKYSGKRATRGQESGQHPHGEHDRNDAREHNRIERSGLIDD